MTTENSAEKIAQLAVDAAAEASVVTVADGREYIAHPPAWVAKEVPVLPQNIAPPIPQWTRQTVNLQNEMSLTEYLNRFKNSDTVIFADITRDTITGIIDYHHMPSTEDTKVKADLGQHRAILTLPRSIEWSTWMEKNEEEMTQLEFVDFLEDNAIDIKAFGDNTLDGAGLKELCRDIEGTKNVKFGSSVRAGSVDNIEFVRESGVQTKGKLALPTTFGISIPIYFGDLDIEMTALLRRRVENDGGLTIWYKLLRPENARQTRFQDIVQQIQSDTGQLTTVYGTAS